MDLITVGLNFLISLGIIILYFTIKNLLPSYFSEKGKNIATREDIEEITSLVESVKHSFVVETEKIKANLYVLSNLKESFISEEIKSIVSHNESYFNWLHLLLDTGLGKINMNIQEELDSYKRSLSEAQNKCYNSETKLRLFVENDSLINKWNDLKIATLKYLDVLPYHFINNISNNNYEIQENKNTKPEDIKNLYDRRKEITAEFNNKTVEGYKSIVHLAKDYQKICRNHIEELIKKQTNSDA